MDNQQPHGLLLEPLQFTLEEYLNKTHMALRNYTSQHKCMHDACNFHVSNLECFEKYGQSTFQELEETLFKISRICRWEEH